MQFFGTPEGRVRANIAKMAWIYGYFLKDHLGNTPMMITDDYNVSSPIMEASSCWLKICGYIMNKNDDGSYNPLVYHPVVPFPESYNDTFSPYIPSSPSN